MSKILGSENNGSVGKNGKVLQNSIRFLRDAERFTLALKSSLEFSFGTLLDPYLFTSD